MIHRCIKQGRQFSKWELEASVNLWWVKTKAIYLHMFSSDLSKPNFPKTSSKSSTLRLTCIAWRKLPGDLRPIGTASIDQWMETSRIPFQDNGCRTVTDRLSCLSILVSQMFAEFFFCLLGVKLNRFFFSLGWYIFSVGRILKCTPVFFCFFYFWFLYDKLQKPHIGLHLFPQMSCHHGPPPCFGALLQFRWKKKWPQVAWTTVCKSPSMACEWREKPVYGVVECRVASGGMR